MTLRTTHTYALLEVSAAAHKEIRGKLEEAEYHHAFDGDVIDMHGIALTPMPPDPISEAFAAMQATESARDSVSAIEREAKTSEVIHLAAVPFKAICGCDKPGTRTNDNRAKVTCAKCLKLDVKGEPLYVLISNGHYWRPDACGYTSDLLCAGTYSEAESAPYVSPDFKDKAITRELVADAMAKLAKRKRDGYDTVDPRMLELFEEAMGRPTVAEVAELREKLEAAEAVCDDQDAALLDFAEEVKRLEKFKTLVHERLDEANVPGDPDPEATAQTGSRITSRLAWVFSRELNGALLQELDDFHAHTIDQGDHDCEMIPANCPVAALLARARGES